MWEMMALGAVAAAGWLLFDTLRAREIAVRIAREHCAREGVQFLDDTVQAARVSLARDTDGRRTLRRAYRFEFCDDGVTRRAGSIVIAGGSLESLQLEPYRFV